MHVFLPIAGMTAKVRPMEQHISRAAVQFAYEILLTCVLFLEYLIDF
jgi:hypothetical protein